MTNPPPLAPTPQEIAGYQERYHVLHELKQAGLPTLLRRRRPPPPPAPRSWNPPPDLPAHLREWLDFSGMFGMPTFAVTTDE